MSSTRRAGQSLAIGCLGAALFVAGPSSRASPTPPKCSVRPRSSWDHWLDLDSWDRCITRGMPSSTMPYRYNNGMQTPG
jgi:hypothetical protein